MSEIRPALTARTCTMCRQEKPVEVFEKRADRPHGRGYRCKACMALRSARYYEANAPQRRAYAREWEGRRTSRRSDFRRLTYAERKERWPHRTAARIALRNAVASGRLVKPTQCEGCKMAVPNARDLAGHHEDYGRPLDVQWLCRSCHGKRHRLDPLPPEDTP